MESGLANISLFLEDFGVRVKPQRLVHIQPLEAVSELLCFYSGRDFATLIYA